jgi:hypothetical protein
MLSTRKTNNNLYYLIFVIISLLLSNFFIPFANANPGTDHWNSLVKASSSQLIELMNESDSDAMAILGRRYAHGLGGLEKDELKALNLWERSAALGNSFGYREAIKGWVLGPNFTISKGWKSNWNKACALSMVAMAQHKLAELDEWSSYIAGICIVEHNVIEGVAILSHAAKYFQSPQAAAALSDIYKNGKYGLTVDIEKAIEWSIVEKENLTHAKLCRDLLDNDRVEYFKLGCRN